MMTLDEAIKHCEEVAKKKDKEADELNEVIQIYPHEDDILEYTNCRECASDHRQLAEWLRELKAYRDTYKNYSKVEKMLICEVEKAKENPSVKKPISYGLYQTWKFWDKQEVAREVNADE